MAHPMWSAQGTSCDNDARRTHRVEEVACGVRVGLGSLGASGSRGEGCIERDAAFAVEGVGAGWRGVPSRAQCRIRVDCGGVGYASVAWVQELFYS